MQNIFDLSFGQIIKLQENLVEVIVNTDVELNMNMIAEYHDWLLENLVAPFGILINKKNVYSYTFEAQMNIANLPDIKAMAVVAYSKSTEKLTNVLIDMPRKSKWNIRIFEDHDIALNWLQLEMDK